MTDRSGAIEDIGWSFPADDGGQLADALGGFLRSLSEPPRLLAFGEAMHGEDAVLRLRNEMFRHLVQQHGYRSIALESGCLRATIVDAFVGRAPGSPDDPSDADDLDDVMVHGLSHGFGTSPANRELVGWMRRYNEEHPAAERVRFFGFDTPTEMMFADSPRLALTTLHRYLRSHLAPEEIRYSLSSIERLIGADDRWTDQAAAMDASRSVGSSPDVTRLRLIAEDLTMLLMSESPRLIPATSPDEFWEATLHARAAAGLLQYHAAMADTSERRLPWLLAIRDKLMADNLHATVEREARRGPAFVFAHNLHLLKGKSRWDLGGQPMSSWTAGAIAGARMGPGYAVIASALGAVPHQGIEEPPPRTLEGRLHALPGQRYLLTAARLADALGDADGATVQRTGTSSNFTYHPLDPARLTEADAVLFLKDIRR